MTATLDELTALFVRLAETPSPSGRERGVADLITAELRACGVDVSEDESAPRTGAAAGNLVARIPGRGAGTPVALCAHMDTVPVEGEVRVRIADGVARSAGDTILGADDKAAVAALVALARDLAAEPPAAGVELVFTTSEEVGLRGAKELDVSALRAEAAFVFDSEGPVGTVVLTAPSLSLFTADFHGRAAHAGIEPEKGRSAVVAAARAVAAMPLGRIDERTTANVGVITGGSATNVVPERCRLEGEARSHDRDALAAQLERMIEAVNVAAAEAGVDVSVTVDDDFVGFTLTAGDTAVALAAAALAAIGVEPVHIATGGGSDANVFNLRGLPAVNLGVGFEDVHSVRESIALARLEQVYELAHALVLAAGARAG
ncbi:MAG TPA: M20/M25/M40 family metallo-hydrolase [Thermoleophilia bacterium]|nr:M20/M25/M40 family metallo-hydrolase [Thermoleophilia bacterium]